MIFVTVGSSQSDFSRLLAEVDRLAAIGILQDVVAQTGYSRYEPRRCEHKDFFPREVFSGYLDAADFVICHGGAGSLEECMERKKKVIVVPRKSAFKEAPDDHQYETAEYLFLSGRALLVDRIEELEESVRQVLDWQPEFLTPSRNTAIVDTLRDFIESNSQKKGG